MAFNKAHTEHFCVFFEPIDQKYVQDFLVLIDGFYNKVANELNFSNGEKFNFYLCPNVETYIELTNKTKESYQDWMVGWTDFEMKKICILSPRVVKDRTYEEMKKVICHEIVHIIFDSLASSNDTALWLSEGIATLFANQIELKYVDEQNFPLLNDIAEEDKFAENGGYDYCGIYVWYFIQKYGIDNFKNVYSGKARVDEYLFSTFEKEAIKSYIEQNK